VYTYTKVVLQRINPDGFEPIGAAVEPVEEAWLLDESLQQDRTVAVVTLPLIGQTTAREGEDARSEIVLADPGQNEKSRVMHDGVEIMLSLSVARADELVPRLALPGTRAEGKERHVLPGGAQELAALRAGLSR
jgi:hypothetical protein